MDWGTHKGFRQIFKKDEVYEKNREHMDRKNIVHKEEL